MRFQSKLLGHKNFYDQELIDGVTRYDLFFRRGKHLVKQTTKLLETRSRPWQNATKIFQTYASQLKTPEVSQRVADVVPALKTVAEKFEHFDPLLNSQFIQPLQNFLILHGNLLADIKKMEKLRKEMQKKKLKVQKEGAQFESAAQSALEVFDSYKEQTRQALKKFIQEASAKKMPEAWIRLENELNASCSTELGAVSQKGAASKSIMRSESSVKSVKSKMGSVRSTRSARKKKATESTRSSRNKKKDESEEDVSPKKSQKYQRKTGKKSDEKEDEP